MKPLKIMLATAASLALASAAAHAAGLDVVVGAELGSTQMPSQEQEPVDSPGSRGVIRCFQRGVKIVDEEIVAYGAVAGPQADRVEVPLLDGRQLLVMRLGDGLCTVKVTAKALTIVPAKAASGGLSRSAPSSRMPDEYVPGVAGKSDQR